MSETVSGADARGTGLQVVPVPGIGEVQAGDDVARLALAAASAAGIEVRDGDVLVVASKVVAKAEGRLQAAADREDAITAETVRVVALKEHEHGVTRIVENRLGLVMAAAGVDASNVPEGTVLLLPEDPDASARGIRATVRDVAGVNVGVIVSDTAGRAWRYGTTELAIGAAGVTVLDDLRGTADGGGRALTATVVAVADQIASAAELVCGKASHLPVAVVRGVDRFVLPDDGPGARTVVRTPEDDLFRTGSSESYDAGYDAGYDDGYEAARADAYQAGYEQGSADALDAADDSSF